MTGITIPSAYTAEIVCAISGSARSVGRVLSPSARMSVRIWFPARKVAVTSFLSEDSDVGLKAKGPRSYQLPGPKTSKGLNDADASTVHEKCTAGSRVSQ